MISLDSPPAGGAAQPLAALLPYGCGVPLAGKLCEAFSTHWEPDRQRLSGSGLGFKERRGLTCGFPSGSDCAGRFAACSRAGSGSGSGCAGCSHARSAWRTPPFPVLSTGILSPERWKLCSFYQKNLLTGQGRAGIITTQNKEGRLHPPHLQPQAKRSTASLPDCPFGRFVVARMPVRYPRFVILGRRCFDH